MGVWGVAGGHAPPPLEPAKPRATAWRAGYASGSQGWGSGCQARGNDGLDAPLRQPGAEDTDGISPVGDPTGQGYRRLGFPQDPGLGAVVAQTTRHAQAQETASSIRYPMDLRTETAPATSGRGIRLFLGGAPTTLTGARNRAVLPHGGQIRGVRHGLPQARPEAPVAPGNLLTINRVPLPVRGRQLAPGECFYEETATHFIAYA